MIVEKNPKVYQCEILNYNSYFMIKYMMSPVHIILIVFIPFFVNINVYFDFVRNIVVSCLYVFLIHSVAHLTMTTFVQERLLYLIVYHDINIVCSNTDIVLTNCRLCLFMIREPGIT